MTTRLRVKLLNNEAEYRKLLEPAKEEAKTTKAEDKQAKAEKNNVNFYWAIHPGVDIKWNCRNWKPRVGIGWNRYDWKL